ncbi:MAG: hypothetical protein ACJ76P_10065 [Actinomycetota bacterium]
MSRLGAALGLRSLVSRAILTFVLGAMLVPIVQTPVQAAPNLTLTPIAWNVVGLDSNKVNTGPNQFAEGARLFNSGTTATNLTATWVWDSANTYVNLYGLNPLTVTSLANGACTDLYYNVVITRDANAYDTARRYHIEVSGSGISTVSTPMPREIYVEQLVSQNRNHTLGVVGSANVIVGNTYTYTFNSDTATGGYDQMSTYLNWPNSIFQILSVSSTYTAPAGSTNDKIYADACGWDPVPTSATYNSCIGPDGYAGGKAGGTMATTYTIKVIAPGTGTMGGLIYDHSGGSFHYNSDFTTNYYSVTATEQADVSITKSDSPDPVTAGNNETYTLHVANAGPSTAHNTTVTDPLPAGTSFVSADNGGTNSAGTVTWNLGDLASGASTDLQLVVKVNASRTTNISNTATVATSTTDASNANNSATQATTVNTSADVSISKSDSPDPVNAGQSLQYTLNVGNAGPSDAQNVSVSDPLPAGVSYVSATPSQGSCSQAAGTVTCSLGSVAAGATPSITINTTAGATGGGISNTATVSSTTSDPSNANNSSTQGTTITPRADLSVTKSDFPDPVVAGNNETYTMVVTNNGPSTAQSVQLSDPLPAGTSFVSADSGGSNSAGTVTWNLGSMANGATTTVHLTVKVNAGRMSNISNTATVSSSTSDGTPGNNSATAGTTVNTSADLSITKSDAPDPVVAGNPLTYTLNVANAGPSDATNVVVSDPLPGGVSYSSATPSQGSCSQAAGTVTCSLGTVSASGTASISIVVTAGASGPLSNTATVSSDVSDPSNANNISTASTTVSPRADLAVTASDSVDPVTAGNNLTYTLNVTNNGPSTATGVTLSDAVPTGTSYVSASPSQGSCSQAAGTVTCSLGSLANGASASIALTVHVDPSRTTPLSDTAAVRSGVVDPNPANDSDTEPTAVSVSADLGVSKSDASDPAGAGTDLTYAIDVQNSGPSNATGVVVSDPVPAGTTFVSADNGGTASGGTVTWNLGGLANGASTTLHVTVHIDPARVAPLSNTASVSATSPDPDSGNDSDTEGTTIAVLGDLGVTVSDGQSSVVAGGSTTYAVTLTNHGVSTAAAGVVVSAPIPGGTSGSESEPNCAISGGVLDCTTAAPLAPGNSVTWHVTLDVDAGYSSGTLDETASITTSTVADTDASNDAATDTDTVAKLADLSVTKSDGADPVVAGNNLTYTISVTNNGPSDTTGVVVTDAVPAGTSFVSADSGGSQAAGTVTWNVGALADGASATMHVTVAVGAGRQTDLSNTASASSSVTDPVGSNDSDTETTSVDPHADVSVTQTDAPDPVSVGGDVTYSLTVGNAGPSNAQAVVVTDTIPSGTSFVSATPSQGSCLQTAGVVTCSLGAVAATGSATIDVVVTTASAGTITNDASVSTTTTDTDASNDSSSEDTTVAALPSADISVVKTDSADPVNAGDSYSYDLVVTNGGPDSATNVSVSDSVPAALSIDTVHDGGGSCSVTGQDVDCSKGSLANGATWTITIDVTVDAVRTAGAISNTANVSADEGDPDNSNNSDTQDTTVSPSADISITKTDSADPVDPGDGYSYDLVITNTGPDAATNVSVADSVPASLSIDSVDDGGGSCSVTGQDVGCTLASLASGTTWTVTVDVTVDPAHPGGTLSNTASAFADQHDPDGSNNSDTQDTTVNAPPPPPSADVSVAKTDSADPVNPGDAYSYDLVVTNNGPDAASNVALSDAVPAALSVDTVHDGGGSCSVTGQDVSCTLASLANGATWTVTVDVTVDPAHLGGTISNTASVSADESDPDGSNNASTQDTTVDAPPPPPPSADVSVAKTDSVDPVDPGDAYSYDLVVTNNGPDAASNVALSDAVPAALSVDTVHDGGGSCSVTGQDVSCTLASLANGATWSVTVDVTVDPAHPGGTISNTANVSADENDPDGTNNASTQDTTVNGPPPPAQADVSVTKTDTADPVNPGDSYSYDLVVTNNGPDSATNVALSDSVPVALSVDTVHDGGGACSVTGQDLSCDLASLANGATWTVTLDVTLDPAHPGGTISNTANVSADENDPDGSNNSSTEDTTVDAPPPPPPSADISVTKTDSADPVDPGDGYSYDLVVSNDGPDAASNIVLSDSVPAALTVDAVHDGGGACSVTGQDVSCDLASLANGAIWTVTVDVTLDPAHPGGTVTNTATVSADETDPDSANNADTQDTTVNTPPPPPPSADISVTKTDSADPVDAGDSYSYDLVVSNNGPDSGTNLALSDSVPVALSVDVVHDGGGSCSLTGQDLSCSLGSLANGATWTVTVDVTLDPAHPGGTISNTASVTADQSDPDSSNNADTQDSTVNGPPPPAQADVSVTKTDSADPVDRGDSYSYDLVVTNNGPDSGTNVALSDSVPAALSVDAVHDGGGSCSLTGQDVLCGFATLANGATWTVTVDVTLDPAHPGGTVTNTATVSADESDPDSSNNSDTQDTTVTPPPPSADISVAKSDSADPVDPGDGYSYNVAVTNNGPDAATNVALSDSVPAGLSVNAVLDGGGSCSTVGNDVTCDLASLANGATWTVTIDVTVDPAHPGGTISNTASAFADQNDPDGSNNSDTEDTTVTPAPPPPPSADVSVTKTDSADPVNPGDGYSYDLVVRNNGPDAATNVALSDAVPAALSIDSVHDGGGSCSTTGQDVSCDLASLANGATWTVTLDVTLDPAHPGGTVTNTATVSATESDPDSSNNSSTQDTTVNAPPPPPASADVSVTKTDSADPVNPGDGYSYDLAVTNNGPDAASNIALSDSVPASLSVDAVHDGGGSCAFTGQDVRCSKASLANGATWTVTVDVTVDPAPAGGTISNTATVSADENDPDSSNNADTEDTAVNAPAPAADISLTKTDTADPVNPGDSYSYDLVVSNNGPDTATNVTVSDSVPASLSVDGVDDGGGSCSTTGNDVTCDLASLANGATWTVTLDVTVNPSDPGGAISNTASAFADQSDPDGSNNSDTEGTTVTPPPASADLSIAKTDSADPVDPGDAYSYDLVVTNNGPDGASNVAVTDPVPGSLIVNTVHDGGGACSTTGNDVSCSLPSLANGATWTVTIDVSVDPAHPGGTIANTANVSADEADPDSSNNSSSEDTTVNTPPPPPPGSADVSITKADSVDPVDPGQSYSYDLVVANTGPADATNVSVSDSVPGSLSVDNVADGGGFCSLVGSDISCSLASLASGNTWTITVSVTVDPTHTGGSISNTATVTADENDPNGGNNSATQDTTVTPPPSADVSLSKTDSADPVNPGDSYSYDLVASNAGPDTASNVTVSDSVPVGLSVDAIHDGGGDCSASSGNDVSCTMSALASGSTWTVTIDVTVDPSNAGGMITNTASVSADEDDPDASNNTAIQDTTVNAPSSGSADLAITNSDSSDPVYRADAYSYDLVVTNNGPDTATNVVATDTVPAGVLIDGTSTASGSCSVTGKDVSCDLGSLSNGSTWDIAIHVKVESSASAGIVDDPADVSASENDPVSANNNAIEHTTIQVPAAGSADLQLDKTSQAPKTDRGANATYLLKVTNHGPSAATNVVVTDTLPSGLEFVSADPGQGTFDERSGDWTVGELDVDGSATMTLVAKVTDESDQVTNSSTVKGLDQSDPTPDNDSSSAVVQVLGENGGKGGGHHHHGGGGNDGGGTPGDPAPKGGPTTQTDVSGQQGLAFTGRSVVATGLIGMLLLGIGGLLLLLGRRRRRDAQRPNAAGF